jgi:hypothetical protein
LFAIRLTRLGSAACCLVPELQNERKPLTDDPLTDRQQLGMSETRQQFWKCISEPLWWDGSLVSACTSRRRKAKSFSNEAINAKPRQMTLPLKSISIAARV